MEDPIHRSDEARQDRDGSEPDYPRSQALHLRAIESLAGGVSSQFRAFSSPHPKFYTHASGARI